MWTYILLEPGRQEAFLAGAQDPHKTFQVFFFLHPEHR